MEALPRSGCWSTQFFIACGIVGVFRSVLPTFGSSHPHNPPPEFSLPSFSCRFRYGYRCLRSRRRSSGYHGRPSGNARGRRNPGEGYGDKLVREWTRGGRRTECELAFAVCDGTSTIRRTRSLHGVNGVNSRQAATDTLWHFFCYMIVDHKNSQEFSCSRSVRSL